MSLELGESRPGGTSARRLAGSKSTRGPLIRAAVAGLATALLTLAALPATAAAHGPVAPIATSDLARVGHVPRGLDAQVIDGDQRMWLSVPANRDVIVLDYVGAPFLRYTAAGVAINQNSAMYYLDQVPALQPPAGLTRTTRPHWSMVSGGRSYEWHDGRLHALATVALAPGASYVGRWTIPLRLDGRPAAIAGGLWHAPSPSPAWFWPIIVIAACSLAAWRVRRPELDATACRVLASSALVATAVAAAGRELHGRPGISILQWLTLAVVIAFVGWAMREVIRGRPGWFTLFVVAAVSIWEGVKLIPVLVDGFVLAATPAFLTRVACVVCLGCGIGLLPFVVRFADQRSPEELDDLELEGPDVRESYA